MPIACLHKTWFSQGEQATGFTVWAWPSEHTEHLLGNKLLRLFGQIGRFFPVEGGAARVRPPTRSCLLLTYGKRRITIHIATFLFIVLLYYAPICITIVECIRNEEKSSVNKRPLVQRHHLCTTSSAWRSLRISSTTPDG